MQLKSQPQISDHPKCINIKLIAAVSDATPKQRAILSHKDTRDVTPHTTLAHGLTNGITLNAVTCNKDNKDPAVCVFFSRREAS